MIKHKRLRVGDISISYLWKEATNPKITILFLHGFPFNKNMWVKQLEALPDEVTGIAVDIRGHGNSTSGHGFFSIDVFAKDLLAFLRKLALEQVTLCGVSMGGYIALRAYELDGPRFSGLVLSDTHAQPDSNAAKIKRFDTIQSVLKHGKRTFSIGFIQNVFAQRTLIENKEAVDLIKSAIRRNTETSICATLMALAARTDTSDKLSMIRVPTLVIRGAEDRITTQDQVDILTTGIPDSTYVEMPECGHLPNLEDPIRFNALLRDFLVRIM